MSLAVKPFRIRSFIFDTPPITARYSAHLLRLLDDIQRLNLETLQWEYVATLANPVAAW